MTLRGTTRGPQSELALVIPAPGQQAPLGGATSHGTPVRPLGGPSRVARGCALTCRLFVSRIRRTAECVGLSVRGTRALRRAAVCHDQLLWRRWGRRDPDLVTLEKIVRVFSIGVDDLIRA